ncbi:MAG: flagellar biosynthesis protein FlhA [Nitrosomonadaceae bacterium]|mgnify:FL=1|jgi:flagellar biosynthesis protein FlhA|nr:flagellar biosynthesis protein FlhA [Nitrosomonadaceae bacterium]
MSVLLLSNLRQSLNFSDAKGLGIPIVILVIMAMFVVPLPSILLDVLFTFNIMAGLVIVMISISVRRPLEFSSFPVVLLLTTMLRLGLNVASTRVVLLRGHEGPEAAGKVIASFGEFVISGNYVVGFIIFMILMIINFIVVTKGAGRTSEVIARFTLDGLPGKQMAIDADLNAGIINQDTALARREEVSQESDFFGSMDGASKFVRGDAIAGILILAINIIGGLLIGTTQHDLPIGEAAEIYVLLTIGDGLVAQVPSLLLSLSTAIIVTRVTTSETTTNQTASQLTNPTALKITAFILLILGAIPGMPHFIFLLSGVLLGTFAFINDRKNEASAETAIADTQALTENEIIDLDWEDIEYVDQIGLEIGYGLIPLVNEEDGGLMLSRVRGVRKKLSAELGFLIQPIRIRDNLTISPTTYNILIKGAIRGTGTLMLGYELAINPGDISEPLEGIKTIEPAFGLDAYWVTKAQSDNAKTLGYTTVDPATVVATHLNAILRANASDLLGHDETREILDKVSTRSPKLIEDLVPDKLPVVAVMQVLKNILFESTSIRDIHTILDTLLTESGKTQNPDELTELVRPRLGRLMIQNIVSLGDVLNVITLDPSLEEILIRSLGQNVGGGMVIEPNLADGIIRSVGKQRDEAENIGHDAVIVVAPPIRPWLSRMLKQRFSDITVLSYTEIPEDQKIKVFARIGMTEETEGEAES